MGRLLIRLKDRNLFSRKELAIATIPFAALLVTALALSLSMQVRAAERQVLRGNVPRAVRESRAMGQVERSTRLNLAIGLPLRNQDELAALTNDLYDSKSPKFHQFLLPEDFAKRFGPSEADYEKLADYVRANGMVITGRHANRTLLEVSAQVSDVERTLHVNMTRYEHSIRGSYFAPDRDPSLDADFKALSISGLDNFSVPQPVGSQTASLTNRPAAADKKALTLGIKAAAQAAGSGPYGFTIGKDLRSAYAPNVTLTGAGQSIALLEFDGFFPADVQSNFALAGLPPVSIETVLSDDFDGSAGPHNSEVILDIDMAGSMAPGAHQIVYEGRNPETVLNRIATDNRAQQISCSWAWTSQSAAIDQIFKQFAAQGQSFLAASGDRGSFPNSTFSEITAPNDNPDVTVVGGTSLTISSEGTWQSEVAWYGSGGGVSTHYTIPSYQQGMSYGSNGGSSTMRNIPDVGMNAASEIYLIYNNGSVELTGGTSAAAPLWAGFIALVNQQAASIGKPRIGSPNRLLYAIGGGPNYALDFHDIASGSNGAFQAVKGYDLVTGWGSPAGQHLIDDLSGVNPPSFTLSVSPFALSIQAGGSGSGTVTVAPKNGFNGSVHLAASSMPSGVTAVFSSTSTTSTSALTLVASNSATPGTYSITIQGTSSGTLSSSAAATLTIGPQPSFILWPVLPSLSITAGNNGSSKIRIGPTNGFNGSVTLAVSGVPSGVTGSLSPVTQKVGTPTTSDESYLSLAVSSSAKVGTYPLTIKGTSQSTSGTLSSSTAITLTINPQQNSRDVPVTFPHHVTGIIPDGASSPDGLLDGGGWGYSGNLLGTGQAVTSHTFNGTQFLIGPTTATNGTYPANAISGGILTLPQGKYSTIKLLATGVNGNQTTQSFRVNYTDGTTSIFQQSLSDWYAPQHYAGELIAVGLSYRNFKTGAKDARMFQLYEYSFSLNSSKTVNTITLPNNRNVVVLSITLAP